jgi:hypothetical protein
MDYISIKENSYKERKINTQPAIGYISFGDFF